MRLGILGGTFDPVHAGHLAMARAAASAAGLDRVLLIPCARPPHKERPDLTDPYHRFAMLSMVVPGEPLLAISSMELRRGGISYTVDTLRDLGAAFGGNDIVLIVGSDSFAEMSGWRQHEEILRRAAVAVVPRPGAEPESLRERLSADLTGILGHEPRGPGRTALPLAFFVRCAPVEISSTDIRNRVREGRDIGGLVPSSVETYIRRQGLYGPSPIC